MRSLIRELIQQGHTTQQIAKAWDKPLSAINIIYAGKRVT